eukprot:COSAG01_NODE_44601_length_417_cov_1.135220_1_plen_62_part_01
MRMLVDPNGTSVNGSSTPHAAAASPPAPPPPLQFTGDAGGTSVMLDPRQKPQAGSRRPMIWI